jgi:hypothetical protein
MKDKFGKNDLRKNRAEATPEQKSLKRVPLRIDSRTVILISDGANPEKRRQRFMKGLKKRSHEILHSRL